MSELKIVSEAGYLLPLKDISKETIDKAMKRFHHRFYNENQCKKCPYLEDRHGENCDNCSGFTGARITAKKVVYKNQDYLSIPRGHKAIAIKLAEQEHKVTAIRIVNGHKPNQQMKKKISLLETTVLKDYQKEAIAAMFDKKRGIIKSPPRSGKTLIATAFMCESGGKTIVLAHQREWLLQFKETFYGSKTQQGFTDAEPGQVDLARTFEDFQKLDVCLCTFSQFMSDKGKAMLAKIRDMFSAVVIDECHKTPALATSRVLASFNAKYVLGLSGTPARKCFAPGTQVSLAGGGLRPIEELCASDKIQSPYGGIDSVSNPMEKNHSGHLVSITTSGGKTIRVTPDHRILTNLGWVEAGLLEPGIHLIAVD